MAEVDTSSYPRPQPGSNNPFDMITNVGKMADTLGNLEVGRGVQAALQPDGSIDRNELAGVLGQSRAGAMKAIPTLDALEKLRTAGYQADANGLDTLQKRFALTSHFFSGLASKPDATVKDVNAIIKQVSDPALGGDKLGINVPLIMNIVKRFHGADGKPLSSKEIQRVALELQTQAASSAEILSQHSPQYGIVDDGQRKRFVPLGTKQDPVLPAPIANELPPSTQVPGPKNQPQFLGNQPGVPVQYLDPRVRTPSVRQALEGFTGAEFGPAVNPQTGEPASFKNRFEAAGVVPPAPVARGPMAAPEPGFEAGIQGEAANSIQMANSLRSQANEGPAVKATLQHLEREVENFTPGPGADYKRIAKSFVTSNIPVPDSWKKEGAILDPKSIADQEGFNKLTYDLAQRQFAALGGTGTDAKLDSTMKTSPNELMSKLGIKGVISLLKGNQDAIDAKAKAWNSWRRAGNGPQTFGEFSENFNSNFDPKVFQFKHMSVKDRQKAVNAMTPEEQVDFARKYKYAKENKWVDYSK